MARRGHDDQFFNLQAVCGIINSRRPIAAGIDTSRGRCCRTCREALPNEKEEFWFCSHLCVTDFWEKFRFSSSGKLCRMPGCIKACYIEQSRVHDFCGKTHAKEYGVMMEEFKKQKVRNARIKVLSSPGGSSSSGGNGVTAGQDLASQQKNLGTLPIRFYNRDQPYYEFTNFYPAPIVVDDKQWPTTEHYFQAQKFIGTPFTEVIRTFQRPREAFDLSRNPAVSHWRRKDWEEVKVDIMRKALLAKFTQYSDLRQMLLGTQNRYLIEHSPYDNFWGNGGDDSGQNNLGLLLMELRKFLVDNKNVTMKQTTSPEDVTRKTPLQRSTSSETHGHHSQSSVTGSHPQEMEPTRRGSGSDINTGQTSVGASNPDTMLGDSGNPGISQPQQRTTPSNTTYRSSGSNTIGQTSVGPSNSDTRSGGSGIQSISRPRPRMAPPSTLTRASLHDDQQQSGSGGQPTHTPARHVAVTDDLVDLRIPPTATPTLQKPIQETQSH